MSEVGAVAGGALLSEQPITLLTSSLAHASVFDPPSSTRQAGANAVERQSAEVAVGSLKPSAATTSDDDEPKRCNVRCTLNTTGLSRLDIRKHVSRNLLVTGNHVALEYCSFGQKILSRFVKFTVMLALA
jgi:hypothetical protein